MLLTKPPSTLMHEIILNSNFILVWQSEFPKLQHANIFQRRHFFHNEKACLETLRLILPKIECLLVSYMPQEIWLIFLNHNEPNSRISSLFVGCELARESGLHVMAALMFAYFSWLYLREQVQVFLSSAHIAQTIMPTIVERVLLSNRNPSMQQLAVVLKKGLNSFIYWYEDYF